jgi:DNA-binding XRE family transcriptional regulator
VSETKTAFSDSRNRLRQVMKIRGVGSADLATAVGISKGTFHNIASGTSKSRKTRQKISNYLATTIWSQTWPETVLLTISKGALLSNLTRSPAELAAAFPNAMQIVNQHSVRVTRQIDLIVKVRDALPRAGLRGARQNSKKGQTK